MTETKNKINLNKSTRRKMAWRTSFLMGTWNFERMLNMGYAYIMGPAIKKLYQKKEDRAAALKRHMEFFNTQPYLAAPIVGVTTAMEEARANGEAIDDAAISGVKVGMMGPLAGVGDPVFWGTLRPVIGAFVATSFAASGNIWTPLIFLLIWNIIRMTFIWYTQELGYQQGTAITKDVDILQKLTYGASILGMFIMGVLVPRWTTMKFPAVVSKVSADKNTIDPFVDKTAHYADILTGSGSAESKAHALTSIKQLVTDFPGFEKVTTLQDVFDQILPGLGPLLLLFFTLFLLRKRMSPIWIILLYFVLGVAAYALGILGK